MSRGRPLVFLLAMAVLDARAADADAGRQIFETRCGSGCHQLPEPASLKATQWPVVLQTMQKRMRQFGMTPLTDEEYDAVLNYLSAHARNE